MGQCYVPIQPTRSKTSFVDFPTVVGFAPSGRSAKIDLLDIFFPTEYIDLCFRIGEQDSAVSFVSKSLLSMTKYNQKWRVCPFSA